MSEKTVIERTKEPITKKHILESLKRLGIQPNDTLLVHSALSSLGWVVGQEVSVIQALLEALPEGTLMMPTHSAGNSDPADWENPPVPEAWIPVIYEHMPAFDPALTPTRGMGRIPELFRTWPGVMRSSHPQTSFSAHGPKASTLTSPHALTPMFGDDSPIAALVRDNGKILLFGVGYDSCTTLHYSELLAGVLPLKSTGCALYEEGQRIFKKYLDYDYDSDDFAALGEAYEATHTVSKTTLGNATLRLVDAADLVAFGTTWLKAHREVSHA